MNKLMNDLWYDFLMDLHSTMFIINDDKQRDFGKAKSWATH